MLLWTPTIRVAGSYASGDDGKGAYKQFDPLLADPQRFHGQMDLFSWSNQIDAGGRVELVPFTDGTVGLEYRYARLAESRGEWIGSYLTSVGSTTTPPVATTTPATQPVTTANELGHEIDVVVAYRPWVPLELRAGWSGLVLGDAAKGIMAAHRRGTPDLAQYAYLQATLTIP